jgi:hypothetical protein
MAASGELGFLVSVLRCLPENRIATEEEVLRNIAFRQTEAKKTNLKISEMTCSVKRNKKHSECLEAGGCIGDTRSCLLNDVILSYLLFNNIILSHCSMPSLHDPGAQTVEKCRALDSPRPHDSHPAGVAPVGDEEY